VSQTVLREESKFFDDAYSTGRFSEESFLDSNPSFRAMTKLLGGLEGKRLLDIGCGVGSLSLQLAVHGALVNAIDISEQAVNAVRHNSRRHNVNLESADIMSITDLRFADDTFDGVVGAAVLHHLVHHSFGSAAMDEVYRTLKPGGKAVFAENNGDNPVWKLTKRYMRLVGARRTGDDLEQPLRAKVLRFAAAKFSAIEFHYPELFLCRIPTTWLPVLRTLDPMAKKLDRALSFAEPVNRLGHARMVYLEK
jgi:2-polyprenyl-3-methyl-5-hydroxy-6-metoxy-1,4-benzoquinol methylase